MLTMLVFCLLSACAGRNRTDGERNLNVFFEQVKQNEAMLVAFLHKMPKGADLHSHPSGAVYGEDFVDRTIEQGLYFDLRTKRFVPKPVRADPDRYYSPADLQLKFNKYGQVLDILAMRDMDKQPESGHDHFFMTWERYGKVDFPDAEQVVKVVHRARMQKIGYVELMLAPAWKDGKIDPQGSKTRFAEINGAVRRYLAARQADDIEVGYTLSLSRTATPPVTPDQRLDEAAYEAYFRPQVRGILELVRDNADLGLRGVTILAPEDAWVARVMFDTQMKIFNEEWRRLGDDPKARPRLNLHGGELTLEYSPYESMLTRISDTVRLGHASRIGHGVSIMWEDDVFGLLKSMKEQGIAVEICLTSNAGILNVVGGKRHPFRLYWEAGVPVVLCTDDEGISRSNLTMEYARAANWFNLSYADMKKLSFDSLEYSFLSGASLFAGGNYSRQRAQDDPALAGSAKARAQARLLREFEDFETTMQNTVKLFGATERNKFNMR
jgi:adenosine deaminase